MHADGTYELSELRQLYVAHGRTVEEADRLFAKVHGVTGCWWIAPAKPARPSRRPFITPSKPPPCRRLEPERSTA